LTILLYALEACPLTKTDRRSLDFDVMRFLMKLFCTSNSDIINECRVYFRFKLPSEIIPRRVDKFMSELSNVVGCPGRNTRICFWLGLVIFCYVPFHQRMLNNDH